MSDNKCNVCQKSLILDEENICAQCELVDEYNNGGATNNVNCGICKDIVEEDSEGLVCDRCNSWYHNDCCEYPLIEDLYSLLNAAPNNVKWFCGKCIWDTEKWIQSYKVNKDSAGVSDEEPEYDHTYYPKEPEIKIEIKNEGMPIGFEDGHSTDSDYYEERKKTKKKKKKRTMEKLYQCTQCEKAFSYKSSFEKHTDFHKDNPNAAKPYQCRHCEKCYAKRDVLREHLKTHTGDKHYQCCHCGKRFTRRDHMKTHERTHTGEKPYQCSHCGRAFVLRHHLTKHERTHTGEKPYQCGYCDKSFARQDNFKNHERIHTGEKPYQCIQCEKCFTKKCILNQHMKTHNKYEPFQSTSPITALHTVSQPNSTLTVSKASTYGPMRTSLSSHNPPIPYFHNPPIPYFTKSVTGTFP